jgi:hypothetical protein
MRLARAPEDAKLFIDSLKERDGCLAVSEMNRLELAFVGDLDRLRVCEDLIRKLLPNICFIEYDPATVTREEDAILGGRSLAVKAQDVVHLGIRGKLVVRNISRSHGGTRDERTYGRVDLSEIDFEALQKAFQGGRKRTEAERLRALVGQKLQAMVALNRSRVDFVAKFKEMIDEYNAGSMNVDELFRQLVEFAKQLSAEEKRAVSENLTEEELALFDILTKPDPVLTKAEEAVVKKVAKDLLEKLKAEKLVYEWRKRQQSRAAVRLWIEHSLDALPRAYTPGIFEKKCERTYEHVFSSYFGEGGSVYAQAS